MDADSPAPLVSDSSRLEMSRFTNFTRGYGAGTYSYGAGLFLNWATMNDTQLDDLKPTDYGYVVGHGGDTYGFTSYQGYIPALRSGLSVAMNSDYWNDDLDPMGVLQCRVAETAVRVLKGEEAYMNCQDIHSDPRDTKLRRQSQPRRHRSGSSGSSVVV